MMIDFNFKAEKWSGQLFNANQAREINSESKFI